MFHRTSVSTRKIQTGRQPAWIFLFVGGDLISPIAKIVDAAGKVAKEAKPAVKQLLDPAVAYTMTQMLEKVVQEGTGTNAQMDRPVAGKTGTTQLPDIAEFKDKAGNVLDGSKDAWFVGYTPEMVAAVWVGYPQTNKTHYLTSTGGKMPASIFKEVMTRALQGQPATAFAPPKGYSPMLASGARINDDGSQAALASKAVPAAGARLETLQRKSFLKNWRRLSNSIEELRPKTKTSSVFQPDLSFFCPHLVVYTPS